MEQGATQQKLYTVDDIYALPDGERAELIDGQIYYMALPNTKHQRISGRLYQAIANYIDSKNGECEIFAAPFAVFLNKNNNYVEPDISVICDKDKITEKGCHGAPDWIIEIVSPGSRRMDYCIKLFQYRTAGVKEYWIVDYEKNFVMVYDFQNDNGNDYTFSDTIPAGTYSDLAIDLSNIKW